MPRKLAFFLLLLLGLNFHAIAMIEITDTKALKALEISNEDIVIGKNDAPITVIEYFAFSCPHCREFYFNTYKPIYDKYIETGQIKWVKRSRVDNVRSLTATMLIMCNAADQKKYKNYFEFLFTKQPIWSTSKNYIEILENISKIAGMSGEEFHQCIENKKLSEEVTKISVDASNLLGVNATPTIFMNNYQLNLGKDFVDFEDTIKKLQARLQK